MFDGSPPVQQLGDHRFELAAGLDEKSLPSWSTTKTAGIALMPQDAENLLVEAVTLEVLRPRDPFLVDERLELVEPALLLVPG